MSRDAFDFSSLREAASAEIDASLRNTQAPESQAPRAPSTPAVETPVNTPVNTPADTEAQLAQLDPKALVRVKVDGEEQIVTVEEALKGYSRTAYLTKRSQALAEQQRQIEAERQQFQAAQQMAQQLQQERAQLEALLNDSSVMARYIQEAFPELLNPQALQQLGDSQAQMQAAGVAPEQVQYRLQRQAARLMQMQQEGMEQVKQEILDAQQTAAFSNQINSHLGNIYQQYPVLRTVEGMEELIRYNVTKMNPQTIGETLQAFEMVSQGFAESINAHFREQQKVQAAKAATLQRTAIEPPGGQGIRPSPTNFQKQDGSIDWDKLRALGETYL